MKNEEWSLAYYLCFYSADLWLQFKRGANGSSECGPPLPPRPRPGNDNPLDALLTELKQYTQTQIRKPVSTNIPTLGDDRIRLESEGFDSMGTVGQIEGSKRI